MRRGGREGKDRVPPSVAVKGVPFACERDMGGDWGRSEKMGNLGERGGAEEDVGRPRVGDMRGKGNKEGGKVWDTKG